MSKNHIALIVKALLSAGLIWFVAARLDFSGSVAQIQQISPLWAMAIMLLFYAQLAISATRYREFLSLLGSPVSPWHAIDATLVGYFFSQTMISFVGGDAMRTFRMAQFGISVKTSAKAVVLDRASGFAGQISLLLIIMPFLLPKLPDFGMRAALIGVVLAALVATVGLFCVARLPEAVLRFRILEVIADLSQRVLRRLVSLRGLYAFFLLSILINAMNCLIFFAIAHGLHIDVSLADMLVMLPPVFFLSMLPISVSGWGVREGASVVALGLAGLTASDSLAISVCFGLGLIVISLPGGLIWLISHKKKLAATADQSQA